MKNRDWEFVKTCGEQRSSIFLIWLIGLFIHCRSFSKQFFADFLPVLFVYAINLLIISTENPQDKTLRIRCGLKLLRLIFFEFQPQKVFRLWENQKTKPQVKWGFKNQKNLFAWCCGHVIAQHQPGISSPPLARHRCTQ